MRTSIVSDILELIKIKISKSKAQTFQAFSNFCSFYPRYHKEIKLKNELSSNRGSSEECLDVRP